MLKYPTYMAVETLTIALVTEDGQSFEDLGIEERKEGQVIIKCREAELMRDGAPCEFNKMGSDGYPFCASSTEVMRLREQNAKLRELATLNWEWAHSCCGNNCKMQTEGCGYGIDRECNYEHEIYDRMRELGVEVDG